MDYRGWVRILGEAARLIDRALPGGDGTVRLRWSSAEESYVFTSGSADPAVLKICLSRTKDDKPLAEYILVPWQDFSCHFDISDLTQAGAFPSLLTVTDFAVIYTSHAASNLNPAESSYASSFEDAFKKAIDHDSSQAAGGDESLDIPDDIQLISGEVFPHYVDLQVALPGSRLPEPSRWAAVSNNRMLHLSLVPDMGSIYESWVKPAHPLPDACYDPIEPEIVTLFDEAVTRSLDRPEHREEIFDEAIERLRGLFSRQGDGCVSQCEKYESRLQKWLLLPDRAGRRAVFENPFPGYQPKLTPDSVTDFCPDLQDEIKAIPAATPGNLVGLLRLLERYREQAAENPGHWEEGNLLLGARPREYSPSTDELLTAETGDRIRAVMLSSPKEQIRDLLKQAGIDVGRIEYTRFTFTHLDVMGSGRFFYVADMETVELHLA